MSNRCFICGGDAPEDDPETGLPPECIVSRRLGTVYVLCEACCGLMVMHANHRANVLRQIAGAQGADQGAE